MGNETNIRATAAGDKEIIEGVGAEQQATEDNYTEDSPVTEDDYLDAYADLAAAYNANSMVADIDETLLSEGDRKRVRGIKKMSLRIAHDCLKEIYGYRFGE